VKIEMVEKESNISISKQCRMLDLPRSFYYYQPVGLSLEDLEILNKIDELYTEDPTRGYRRLKAMLNKKFNINVGKNKVKKYMNIIGIQAIYPKKKTTITNIEHVKYPYLLRGVEIKRVNQVWSMDITYIRLKKGFVYLTAIIDWHSRYVLSWRLSITMDKQFCLEALEEAIEKYGTPEIFNTDQGSQFTSKEFTEILKKNNIRISMDGKGRALDNIFIERLWRTVKYEDVYIKDYQTVSECKKGLKNFFERYNNKREHQSLDYQYPSEVYFKKEELEKVG